MFVQYGTYKHDVGEVELNWQRDVLFTEGDTPYAELHRVDLSGMLLADSQVAMDAKVRALARAYAKTNVDLRVNFTSGGPTYLHLVARRCTGGIRVVRGPSFPTNRGAAYTTYLPYTVGLEAEVPLATVATALRSFSETISRSGGGPRYGLLETLNTLPEPQALKRATIYKATQAGSAVGLYGLPTVPLPIWPQWLIGMPKIETATPRRRGSGSSLAYVDFSISWAYEFESRYPLVGRPTRWR